MTTFTVASFGASGSMDIGGQSFTPNVPGPDGTGSPGTAKTVLLNSISVGYPTSDVSSRSAYCYVYSVELDDPSEVGQTENMIALTNSSVDASVFGTGTYSRTYNFSGNNLDPTATYYVYFTTSQYLRYKAPAPYTGGNAQDDGFDDLPGSIQFQVSMSA